MLNRPPRPASLTVLAAFGMALGLLSILMGFAGALLGLFSLVEYYRPGVPLFLVLGPVLLLFGSLEIAYSVGFLVGGRWSWPIGVVTSLASLVFTIGTVGIVVTFYPTDPVSWIITHTLYVLPALPIAIGSATLLDLWRSQVKTFFGKDSEAN